jgi:hypothetical protein
VRVLRGGGNVCVLRVLRVCLCAYVRTCIHTDESELTWVEESQCGREDLRGTSVIIANNYSNRLVQLRQEVGDSGAAVLDLIGDDRSIVPHLYEY